MGDIDNLKILVVDDNESDRCLLRKTLERNGYNVQTAEHGMAALELAEKHKPDIIITDILMPVVDGFQLCRELKKDPELYNIPIIFYTATYTENEDEKLAMETGAEAFIRKPEEPKIFIEKIRNIIKKYQNGETTPRKIEPPEEHEYMAFYNKRLIKKLEKKTLQLENTRKKLETAYEELKTIDTLKDNIISNLTHELRTPILLATGYLELAMEEKDNTKKSEYLNKCMDAIKREDKVVLDLIETASGEKGIFKPKITTIDIKHLIESLIKDLTPKALPCKISITTSIEKDLTTTGDYNQLKHAISNILDNAIKFNNKEGKVEITANTHNTTIQIHIKDTGIGIPEDKLNKIFDKLYQIDSSRARKYGGTGMGLAVTKHIIENHKGKIRVESKIRKGSTFHITLPKNPA